MKLVLIGTIAATIIAALPASAATAYDAMRAVGKQKGDATLEKITEVRGTRGTPQPNIWKISTKETSYEVRGTKLGSTSAGRPLPALNLSELKLDSDGAHTVAEREAKKAAFAYDYADYTLRSGSKATPVWEVRLVDAQSDSVATLNIGADTGKVISSDGLKRASGQPKTPVASEPPVERPSDRPAKPGRPQEPKYVEQDPRDYDPADEPRQPVRNKPSRTSDTEEEESDDSRYNQGYEKVIDRVGNHLKLRGRQLRSWFDREVRTGGRPTYVGSGGTNRYQDEERYERRAPAVREPAPRVTRPDPNETRYYKPAPGDRLRD